MVTSACHKLDAFVEHIAVEVIMVLGYANAVELEFLQGNCQVSDLDVL